jgi:hypothetical protein
VREPTQSPQAAAAVASTAGEVLGEASLEFASNNPYAYGPTSQMQSSTAFASSTSRSRATAASSEKVSHRMVTSHQTVQQSFTTETRTSVSTQQSSSSVQRVVRKA